MSNAVIKGKSVTDALLNANNVVLQADKKVSKKK